MTSPDNPEKAFLIGILSMAEDRSAQLKYLNQLGSKNFDNPAYQEAFKACCMVLMPGGALNLETFAKYLCGKIPSEMFRQVCFELHVKRYVDCLPAVDARLRTLIEELMIRSLERKYQEAV